MLTDGVITLRHPTFDDVEAVYVGCQDPDVPKWTNVPSPYVRAHAEQWIERTVAERAAGRTQAFLAFYDDQFAASCSLMELDRRPGYGEIGYWVAKPARRRGVATRAVKLLRDFGVRELGLDRVELLIHEDNARSRCVAAKAGFTDTGERRPAPRTAVPGPPDHVVYAWSAS
jgi:RimJ/RimL family protein N-acetyltransferase